jgi:hypothetical protein
MEVGLGKLVKGKEGTNFLLSLNQNGIFVALTFLTKIGR